jgi:hypothetical protein
MKLARLLQSARFCIVCLGRDTQNLPLNEPNQTLNTVYNIVVRSPEIVAYRQKVQVGAWSYYYGSRL